MKSRKGPGPTTSHAVPVDIAATRAALIRAGCALDDALTATQSADMTWALRAIKEELQGLLAKVATP